MKKTFMLMLLILAGGMHAITADAAGVVSNTSLKQAKQAMPPTDMAPARMHLFQQSMPWFG